MEWVLCENCQFYGESRNPHPIKRLMKKFCTSAES